MLSNINWTVRFKNKLFWLAIIPAVLVLIHDILIVFGVNIDFTILSGQLIQIVKSVFGVLAILGIVVDPTTDGVGDSSQAMRYTSPKKG